MRWRVVLDRSVLIAALRSRSGASFHLLTLLGERRYEIVVSVPLVLEYEGVLTRPGDELGLERADALTVVDHLCAVGKHQEIDNLWRPILRDPGDEFVIEVAVAGRCQAIVTHNVRDFAGVDRFGVDVLRPDQFIRRLEEEEE
jgi:putative PIN family toxin of toxin-antitoxin system